MSVCADDVGTTASPSKMLILRTIFESLEPVNFEDLVVKLKTISAQERVIINNILAIINHC